MMGAAAASQTGTDSSSGATVGRAHVAASASVAGCGSRVLLRPVRSDLGSTAVDFASLTGLLSCHQAHL